ncbi:MAG TPA: metallophosphoesterase [Phycisphaerae bacterium]|nr:metallophosphoesterase [Phycisphaerales bacterium]HRX85325.1 metallophosphoesterase [Phycisphaerae bacterium]
MPRRSHQHHHHALAVGVLVALAGCGALEPDPLPDTHWPDVDSAQYTLVARFAQISDAHALDEESPGRTAILGRLISVAWRPHERYSLQLIDGMIRAVNYYHERVAPLDFLIHTGDAVDNVQFNELHWFLDVLDGRMVNPLSGIDDRLPEDRGPPARDPYVPFKAAGLYRQGVNGEAASIPWYAVMGNHDRYAVGVLPIVPRLDGGWMAPLPGGARLGLFLPVVLVPDGPLAYGTITPANPGPLPELLVPSIVQRNPDRRFVTPEEYVAAYFTTATGPPGHGFGADGRTWYATSPRPGLRLIVLDTSLAPVTVPGGDYHAGGLIAEQVRFLRAELEKAQAAGDLVVVATHHPSIDLSVQLATTIHADEFRQLLNGYPNVVAHIAGHEHCNRVTDRGGYLEFETSAVIDPPHEGRIIEIWRRTQPDLDGGDAPAVILRYALFAGDYTGSAFADVAESPSDPLLPMRRDAQALAEEWAGGVFDGAISHCP